MHNGIQYTFSQFRPLKSKINLAEQIFEILQQVIANGDLGPNERLVEVQIARGLGVSRTPVREALKRLEITGYARTAPGGGIVVSDDSTVNIRNLFEIREALETMSIDLACQRASEEQINEVEQYYIKMIQAIKDNDLDQYLELHRAFHEGLCEGCGNEQLSSLVRAFRYQSFDRRLVRVFTSNDWRSQIKSHGRVIEALRERKPQRAVKAVHRDFKSGLKVALKRL